LWLEPQASQSIIIEALAFLIIGSPLIIIEARASPIIIIEARASLKVIIVKKI